MTYKKGCTLYYIFSNLISAVSINSAGTLLWHNGVIPETEIWVKLGGDKGSIHSTCVFACFEAQDTIANFHIALDRYKDEVTNLGILNGSEYAKYKKSVHSNIALFIIATGTEVTISESFYLGITSFYVHYMAIHDQAQVVCELN